MSWRQMIEKVMKTGRPLRFTEVVNRVSNQCETLGYDYAPEQVRGSVSRTLGNGLKTGKFTRPERGVYIRVA